MNYNIFIAVGILVIFLFLIKNIYLWIINGFTYFCIFYTIQSFWKKRKNFLKLWKYVKFWIITCLGFDPFFLIFNKKKEKNKHIKLSKSTKTQQQRKTFINQYRQKYYRTQHKVAVNQNNNISFNASKVINIQQLIRPRSVSVIIHYKFKCVMMCFFFTCNNMLLINFIPTRHEKLCCYQLVRQLFPS